MRISIPSIPESSSNSKKHFQHNFDSAKNLLKDVLQKYRGRILVMTGAGVSVDSGISSYRGANGHYTIHKTYRPIFFHEFVNSSFEKGHPFRQRYWSRSFLGYPPVLRAKPNKTHFSIAALQRLGYFENLITQNVDNLHHIATPSISFASENILELHGTLQNVVCVQSPIEEQRQKTSNLELSNSLSFENFIKTYPNKRISTKPLEYNTPFGKSSYPNGCGYVGSRAMYQLELSKLNPDWENLANEMKRTNKQPKTNPDGDVQLENNVDYSSFNYPCCPNCGGILKPSVIFFGESVPNLLKQRSFDLIERNQALLLIGTSLATYSAFRLVKTAKELGQRVVLLNKGPTRADNLVDDKIDGIGSSEILHSIALDLANKSGSNRDKILTNLLTDGETILPNERDLGIITS